jgi:hypothetical protein
LAFALHNPAVARHFQNLCAQGRYAMTHIQKAAAALVAAGLAVTTAAMAAQDRSAAHHNVGQNVTLTSCVEKGQTPDTFILTKTSDVPVHPPTLGRVVYWLDTVKPLREHVGHQVRVVGSITEVKQGEMEVKLGDDEKGGWVVEIEGPGRDVRTTPEKAGVAVEGRESQKDDIKTTVVKLKVSDVTMTSSTCPTQ